MCVVPSTHVRMCITPTVLLCVRMCGTVHSLQDENDSTPKSMSLLRKKLGKVMSKSVGRKGTLAALNSALLLLSSLFPLDLLMEIMRRQCLFCVCVCVYVRTYVHIFGVECRVLWSRQLTVSLLHHTPTTAMVTCHNARTVAHLSTVCDVLPNSGKFSQESYIHTYIHMIQLLELALCANVRTCMHAPVSGSPLALSTCCVRYLRH